MLSWQRPKSPQQGSSQKSQRTIVAFQYALLVLSSVDSAGAIYLLLGPGNEVTIAGASPMLTAVSKNFNPYKLLKAEIRWTRRLYQLPICCSIKSCLGNTSTVSHFRTLTGGMSCLLRA